jgi:Na+/melibiose symporter-like transporter
MNTSNQGNINHQQGMNPYVKFTLMILTSTIVMFIMMYFNTYQLDHVYFSETRAYMALYMGAVMAIIMLAFMSNMYKKTKINLLVYGSVVMFAVGLWGVRSQATVDQVDWMQAMIPHHSIAILTSSRADIEDPRVQQLADDIIKAQKREIAEMQALLE